jgi:hypothetical protein
MNGVDFDMAGWFCNRGISRGYFREVGIMSLEISNM